MWRLEGVRPRVLVTGIGGPAAQAFIGAFEPNEVDWFVADMDPFMPGYQLFEPDRRAVVPRGDDDGFAEAVLELALAAGVDAVVPTVDAELLPLARARSVFGSHGIVVLTAEQGTLELCLDKLTLAEALTGRVAVPHTAVLDGGYDPVDDAPVVVKPRSGSGGRGIRMFESGRAIASDVPRDGSHIVQEFLPGGEYSIDVFADRAGNVVAAVPRERIRVDSGIATVSRTVADDSLMAFGIDVAKAIGLTTVANVQARLRADGTPALLEVNPRFPGTMSLTVASGVNMPRLALTELFGGVVPTLAAFRETVLVRTWSDHVVDRATFGRSGFAPKVEAVA